MAKPAPPVRSRHRVAVVTDSTAALPAGAAARWGIDVVPLDVVVDGRPHTEGVDLAPADLVAALRAGAKVSTSQPAPEAFSRAYARAAAAGASAVVSVHLSGELSGTVASARSAAERAPLPVHVVDSRSVAMGIGFAALAAAWEAAGVPDEARLVAGLPPGPSPARHLPGRASDLAADLRHLPGWAAELLPGLLRREEPATADQVADAARAAASAATVWFLVDSLEHLRRGGRLSAAAAALGTVLGLRPLLTVADGRVVVGEKIRTRRAARERLEAVAVAAAGGHRRVRLAVHHTGDAEAAAGLAARLPESLGDRCREVVVSDAGAVLGAHAGPGLLAVVVAPV